MFDSSNTNLLSSGQLAAALIDHLNKYSCDAAHNIIENDDFPVEVQAVEVEKTAF